MASLSEASEGSHEKLLSFVAAILAMTAAEASANGLKRMYVLDCGRLIAKDQSRWTPGVNAGQPRELSNNCYLFQHQGGTLLWDTGVPDAVAEQKGGVTSLNGAEDPEPATISAVGGPQSPSHAGVVKSYAA